MRTILIVFALLLVLLTLLGTFGGSIKYSEPFYEVSAAASTRGETPPKFVRPMVPASARSEFVDGAEDDMPEEFYDGPDVDSEMIPVRPRPQREYYEGGPPPAMEGVEGVQPPAPMPMPTMPTMPATQEPTEGFMIEPFEADSKSSYPASF